MKQTIAYLLSLIIFCSCINNHYHDGVYKGTVVNGYDFLNAYDEKLTINGGEMLIEQTSMLDKNLGSIKVPCTQFQDKIEFKVGDITKILTVDTDTTLKLSDYLTYKKIN